MSVPVLPGTGCRVFEVMLGDCLELETRSPQPQHGIRSQCEGGYVLAGAEAAGGDAFTHDHWTERDLPLHALVPVGHLKKQALGEMGRAQATCWPAGECPGEVFGRQVQPCLCLLVMRDALKKLYHCPMLLGRLDSRHPRCPPRDYAMAGSIQGRLAKLWLAVARSVRFSGWVAAGLCGVGRQVDYMDVAKMLTAISRLSLTKL